MKNKSGGIFWGHLRGGVRSGPVFVLALVALGLVAGAGTWWNYTQSNFSSHDAILRVMVPPDEAKSAGEESEKSALEAEIGAAASEAEQARMDEARAEAEIELGLLQENLAASKEALEQAVVMVREAKENFDFAADRHEKLMPLVETGALEPLAASQIQSAYISARAAFATAKFLLAQARQEYGSLEARKMRWELAAGKLQRLGVSAESAGKDEEEFEGEGVEESVMPETQTKTPPETPPNALVEAWFAGELVGKILPGMQARISLPSGSSRKLGGVVQEVQEPTADGPILVILQSSAAPPASNHRSVWPVQVTIDASLPRVAGNATDEASEQVSEGLKP